MQWGFKSAWSRQPLINAKAETIATTVFKHHLHQRCLIPADGFYEWTADRTPIRFTLPDNGPFCFAGLWRKEPMRWGEATDEPGQNGNFSQPIGGQPLISFASLAYFAVHLIRPPATFSPARRRTSPGRIRPFPNRVEKNWTPAFISFRPGRRITPAATGASTAGELSRISVQSV